MPHAYFVIAEQEEGIANAIAFARDDCHVQEADLVVLRYPHFSVEEARRLTHTACTAPIQGEQKAIIVAASRFFYEAQNALLKLFEEPPPGVVLILVIPSEGVLLPTLRSRLAALPVGKASNGIGEQATAFLALDDAERGSYIEKLLARTKSDNDDEKQQARVDALHLAEGLLKASHAARKRATAEDARKELLTLEEDLTHFLPLFHTRSAPLKLIFEHLLLVIPKNLKARHV